VKPGKSSGVRPAAGSGKGRSVVQTVSDPQAPAIDHDRFPNLAALEAWDREMHIRAAMSMGLTRKQAELHAEEEISAAGGQVG
jgi:hypothetical protein